jgi:hypothetical protein
VTLFLLAACPAPDPDTLLRAGRVDDALAAWVESGGAAVPAGHPTAQALAVRAPREAWITVAVLVELTQAAALLEAVPDTRTQDVDVSFERWAPLAPCLAGRLRAPWRVAVGRTAVAADGDVTAPGGRFENVPYAKGRIVGSAAARDAAAQAAGAAALGDLFARLDADPPSRRVTLALTDEVGPLAVHLTRQDGAWWTVAATQAAAAAELIVTCGRAG